MGDLDLITGLAVAAGLALRAASWKAIEPAIRNAIRTSRPRSHTVEQGDFTGQGVVCEHARTPWPPGSPSGSTDGMYPRDAVATGDLVPELAAIAPERLQC